MSSEGVMRHRIWGHAHPELFLKLTSRWCIVKCVLTYSLGSIEKTNVCGARWLRGRASDSQLREPGFESCAAVLKPWASFFTLHCSSSLSRINEYPTKDSGGYVYEQEKPKS